MRWRTAMIWKSLAVGLIAVATAIVMVRPALAVAHGERDGDGHPYVGLVVFYDDQGTPLWRASGTLISPRVFLTAGHATYGTASAQVWFDPEVTDPGYPFSGGITGTPITHPLFGDSATFPNTSDIGVVILDEPVFLDEYPQLPPLGVLDAMATQRGPDYPTFKVVGYGLQSVVPRLQADLVRYRATVALINLRNALTDGYNIQHTGDPGQGHGPGGTCFGDSGGPVFLGDSNIIVAVVSFGLNTNCVGPGFAYRTDIENSQGFIDLFLE